MLRLDDPALPRLDSAPFWQPISTEEYGAIVGDPPLPGDLDFADGWALAAYSIFMETKRRHTVVGWVRGPFAIADFTPDELTVYGRLYHLPVGLPLSTFATAELAAFAAALLEPIADWSTVTREQALLLALQVRETLEDAGFHHEIIPTITGMLPVWFREIGELN